MAQGINPQRKAGVGQAGRTDRQDFRCIKRLLPWHGFEPFLKEIKILSHRDETGGKWTKNSETFSSARTAEEQMRRGKSPEDAWRIARAPNGKCRGGQGEDRSNGGAAD